MEVDKPPIVINWPLYAIDVWARKYYLLDDEKDILLTIECIYENNERTLLFDANGVRIRMKCQPWDGITIARLDYQADNYEESIRKYEITESY